MRHRHLKSYSRIKYTTERTDRPYNVLTFSKPRLGRRYVEVIQYVYDHPNCKRVDILRDIFDQDVKQRDNYDWYKYAPLSCRGHQSSLFANLLYADFIDYDKKFRYHVTEKGMKLLIDCYQQKMVDMCKPKQMTFNFFN